MKNQSRRTFLKGMAYGSAVALGGMGAIAQAASSHLDESATFVAGSALPSCDISIMAHQTVGSEVLTLSNHTSSTITVDEVTPVGLDFVDSKLSVELSNMGAHTGQSRITLAPGESFQFVVVAATYDVTNNATNNIEPLRIPNVLAGQLRVKSNHAAFDGVIPVTVFDAQVAA